MVTSSFVLSQSSAYAKTQSSAQTLQWACCRPDSMQLLLVLDFFRGIGDVESILDVRILRVKWIPLRIIRAPNIVPQVPTRPVAKVGRVCSKLHTNANHKISNKSVDTHVAQGAPCIAKDCQNFCAYKWTGGVPCQYAPKGVGNAVGSP